MPSHLIPPYEEMHMMTEAKGNPHALRGPSILYAEGRIYREAFP